MQPATIATSISTTAQTGGPEAPKTGNDSAAPEREAGVHDLRQPRAHAGDAERTEKESAGERANDEDRDGVGDAEAERVDEQRAGQEGEEIRERGGPDEEELAGMAAALAVGNGLQAARLEAQEAAAEWLRLWGRARVRCLVHVSDSYASIVWSGSKGRRGRGLSAASLARGVLPFGTWRS
jgi:hypothetical protein